MRRYAFVEQHSEEDCGAACLAMIARHYGKKVSLPLVRQLVGTGQQGTTLLGLRRGGDELGFNWPGPRISACVTGPSISCLSAATPWS